MMASRATLGMRCWAAVVIVLQCERGGRPATACYGFWAVLYAAFGAQNLTDEAATTSLIGALAAAFALAVRVVATAPSGGGRAAAAEVVLHCLGCAGVAFAAWATVHDESAPADAHGHGRLALALCAGAAPALGAAAAARSGGSDAARLWALGLGAALASFGAAEAAPPRRVRGRRKMRRKKRRPRPPVDAPACFEGYVVLDADLRKTRGVSRNDVACAPAAPPTLLAIACLAPALAALGGGARFAPLAALAEGVLLAALPLAVALVVAAAAGNALDATPWWALADLPRLGARGRRLGVAAVLVAAETRLGGGAWDLRGLPAAAAAAAAAARVLGAPGTIVAAACAARLLFGPVLAGAALALVDVVSKKDVLAAWPVVAACGAALAVATRAGPLATLAALAPLPWALARPEERFSEDAFVSATPARTRAAACVAAHALASCWARSRAGDATLSFVSVAFHAAWALARRGMQDDAAGDVATGLLLCLGAGDLCAALVADFARGPALGLIATLLAAPGVLLSAPQSILEDARRPKHAGGALASLGLAAVSLILLARCNEAEGTALFESAALAAWALSARVAACWLPPHHVFPRKAAESALVGAAAGALYLAHADATLLATVRLVCLAGALGSAGRAHVAGALLAAAVEAPQVLAMAFLSSSLALLGAAAAAPRRAASRFEERVVARPDRAVVLASACAFAATLLTHYSAAALPLFAAAAAYAARRLRAQHAMSLGDAFARQDGRAGGGADAAALAGYAAAAAHASALRRHWAAAGWGVALCAAPVLLALRRPRKGDRRLPVLVSSYEARHVTAVITFLRGAAWVLGPTFWLAGHALGRGTALLPLLFALAGPASIAAAATQTKRAVHAALAAWPLTLAPFFLRGATGDGMLLGALGCLGSAGVALFYEESRAGWED